MAVSTADWMVGATVTVYVPLSCCVGKTTRKVRATTDAVGLSGVASSDQALSVAALVDEVFWTSSVQDPWSSLLVKAAISDWSGA